MPWAATAEARACSDRCEWCDISPDLRVSAPRRSLLTLTLAYGIDEGIPLAFDGLSPRGRALRNGPAVPNET
jgi:hypothetical protein